MNILFKEHMKSPDISRQYHIIHAGYIVRIIEQIALLVNSDEKEFKSRFFDLCDVEN